MEQEEDEAEEDDDEEAEEEVDEEEEVNIILGLTPPLLPFLHPPSHPFCYCRIKIDWIGYQMMLI